VGDQEALRQNLDELRELPRRERDRLDGNRRRWDAMSPEEQRGLRERMRRLREMTPERRRELLDRALDSGGAGEGGQAGDAEAGD
jgi:hypothetical protein